MTCHSHPFGDPKGLDCIRTDVHSSGHIYQSTSGIPGRHEKGDDE